MNLIDFLNKVLKTKVDFDGAYGAQCVDLFRRYHQDVIGGEHTGAVVGARDLYNNFSDSGLPDYYYRKSIYKVKIGDVVIFDQTKTNPYGHVALFLGWVDTDRMLIAEQDGFKQDGVKLAVRSRDNVMGVLSPDHLVI